MVPFSTWGERLDSSIRITLAYGLVIALFILNIVALPHPFTGLIQIPFVLIALYYWSIYRPTLFPAFLAFAAGLFLDIIGGGPLGVNALIFYAFYWVVADQRGFLLGQSFWVIWFGFGILNACVVLIKWFVFGLLQFNWGPLLENMPAIALGFIAFPFIAIFLHLSHRVLPNPQMSLMGHNQAD